MARRFQNTGAHIDVNREETPFARTLRRHHNNDGRRQIKAGKTVTQVDGMSKRLGIDPEIPRYMRSTKGRWC